MKNTKLLKIILIRLRACRRPRIFSPAIYAPQAKLCDALLSPPLDRDPWEGGPKGGPKGTQGIPKDPKRPKGTPRGTPGVPRGPPGETSQKRHANGRRVTFTFEVGISKVGVSRRRNTTLRHGTGSTRSTRSSGSDVVNCSSDPTIHTRRGPG